MLAAPLRHLRTLFDPILVRRCAQRLVLCPPGTLVRLSGGEIAVVTHVHAPAPQRPLVRVLFAADGRRLDLPQDRSLWEAVRPDGTLETVEAPVDPGDFGIDPLNYIETA